MTVAPIRLFMFALGELMSHWTLDDIDWNAFDPAKVDPDILMIIKAAALVEFNGHEYVRYLCNVFNGDGLFQDQAKQWGDEEVQHGAALGRWATLADPTFSLDATFKRFIDGYNINTDVKESIRGSKAGELIARCIVETGTSSYYTALADAIEEPVLKDICRRIAADELRHYKLFYQRLKTYQQEEGLGFWRRLSIAVQRIAESEDDELTYAYFAANASVNAVYDRHSWKRAYAGRAYAVYRQHHVQRAIGMILKAVGLPANGRLNAIASRFAWLTVCNRVKRLARYVHPGHAAPFTVQQARHS